MSKSNPIVCTEKEEKPVSKKDVIQCRCGLSGVLEEFQYTPLATEAEIEARIDRGGHYFCKCNSTWAVAFAKRAGEATKIVLSNPDRAWISPSAPLS